MQFGLLYHPSVGTEDLPALHPVIRSRIRRALRERVAVDPARFGKPLRGTLRGLWSPRVGDYRVVYTIMEDEVFVLKIGHRREAYRQAGRREAGGR